MPHEIASFAYLIGVVPLAWRTTGIPKAEPELAAKHYFKFHNLGNLNLFRISILVFRISNSPIFNYPYYPQYAIRSTLNTARYYYYNEVLPFRWRNLKFFRNFSCPVRWRLMPISLGFFTAEAPSTRRLAVIPVVTVDKSMSLRTIQ